MEPLLFRLELMNQTVVPNVPGQHLPPYQQLMVILGREIRFKGLSRITLKDFVVTVEVSVVRSIKLNEGCRKYTKLLLN